MRVALVRWTPVGESAGDSQAQEGGVWERIQAQLEGSKVLEGREDVEFLDEMGRSFDLVVTDEHLPRVVALGLRGMGLPVVCLGHPVHAAGLVDISLDPDTGDFVDDERLPLQEWASESASERDALRARDTRGEASGSGVSDLVDILQVARELQWDSSFFGFPVVLVTSRRLTPRLHLLVEKKCEELGAVLVEYRCDCHDRESVLTAEAAGFSFVDVRLTYVQDLRNRTDGFGNPVDITLATKEDIPVLRDIATGAYVDSRYYFDGNFRKLAVEDFYQGWIEKAVLGVFDDLAWVSRDSKGVPNGYCSVRFDEQGDSTAFIGLVGLSKTSRGRGLGVRLMHGVLDKLVARGVEKVIVVTQGRNYMAQRLYQNTGFVTQAVELWYHKWIYRTQVP